MADKLTVRIGADVTDFQSKVQEVGQSLRAIRTPVQAFSSALSSAGRIARLMGDDGAKLANQIDTLTIAVSAATVATQALRGVLATLPAVMAAVRVAIAALTGPVGWIIAAVGVLAAGLLFLVNRKRDAARAARDLGQSFFDTVEGMEQVAFVAARLSTDLEFVTNLVRRLSGEIRGLNLEMRGLLGAEFTFRDFEGEARAAEEAARRAKQAAEKTRAEMERRFQDEAQQIVEFNIWQRQQWEKAAQARTAAFVKSTDAILEDQERQIRGVHDAWERIIRENEEMGQLLLQQFRADEEERRKLKEETEDLIHRANQQAIEREDERQREAIEAGQRLLDDLTKKAREATDRIERLVEPLQAAFAGLFSDILSGAKSFGDAITNFFRSVVNAIIATMARLAAIKIINLLFGLKIPLFAQGGIVQGGLVPAFAGMQDGGIVSRPTFAMVGEGQQAEAVVPLPDNRHIPVKMLNGDKREIIVQTFVVSNADQIAQLANPDAIIAVIAEDIRKGGVTSKTIKAIR